MAAIDDLVTLLEDRWLQLEAASDRGRTRVMTTPITRSGSNIRLGAGAARHAYIPVSEAEAAEFTERRRGSAMQVRCIRERMGDPAEVWIDIACLKPDAHDVFALFVADILTQVDADPEAAPTIVQSLYTRWRKLFATGGRLLGPGELIGLYAELRVLDQLLAIDASAAERWVGPFSGAHDFTGPTGTDIEVKATTMPGHTINVHGFGQLEPPPGGSLYLCYQHLETNGAAGESVPDLVTRVLGLGDSHVIRVGLEALNYNEADEDEYRRTTFQVSSEAWYHVCDGFPRLIDESFEGGTAPSWLGEINYELDLSAAVPFLADPKSVEAAQRSVAAR